jgi:mannosyltransferase OCH1-like enzyme/glycosyltransferase involved in cell wall biosynthesis
LLIDFISFHFRLLRREPFDRVGGIDRDFRSAEDYDLCLKLSEITDFYHLEQPLYYYRKHDLSISAVTKTEQTEYSAKAVNNALLRRNLADRYRFLVAPTGQFHLQQRQPQLKSSTIPKIIHQTWKDENIPPQLAALQQTWRERHPDWEYKLWTDTENREFLARFYPWFLPIYDSYQHHICRVDAIRYFWLDYYGGIYIDLDFECLAPIDLLIAERSILLSLEPSAHTIENDMVQERNLSEIISPAWMASAPEHPFWQHVWQHLVNNRSHPNVLDATGPFLLTHAYQTFDGSAEITVIPADRLHPITLIESQNGRLFDLAVRESIAPHALGIHHWHGSWWHNKITHPNPLATDTQALVVEKNHDLFTATLNHNNYQKIANSPDLQPQVSCLMVTKDRAKLAKRSIFCFLQQTYPNKELVIIDNGNSPELVEFIRSLNHPQINYYQVSPAGLTLGDFRNLSVAKAQGDYLAIWDDDDLSDPARLELQMAAIQTLRVDFCLLDSVYIWWPHQQRLAQSWRRTWEGSIVCRQEIFPTYPSYQRGEDTELVESLMARYRVAALNRPELYLYCYHESNTYGAAHFEHNWHVAQSQFEHEDYINMMQQLELRLPIHSYLQSLRSISMNNEVEILDSETIPTKPLVSCLMVTKNRDQLARSAIECFLNQTYPDKELIIIDDGDRHELEKFVTELNSPQIVYYRLPSQGLTLGELRNLAVEKATGYYLAQWDDDDLYHPQRLELQVQAIVDTNVDGCYLNSLYMWWPDQQRLAHSCQRSWECTLVCRKEIFPAYPHLRQGEDTEV